MPEAEQLPIDSRVASILMDVVQLLGEAEGVRQGTFSPILYREHRDLVIDRIGKAAGIRPGERPGLRPVTREQLDTYRERQGI